MSLPTSTFAGGRGDVFTAGGAAAGPYIPGEMTDSEIVYGSAGKTGLRVPGARPRAAEESGAD